MTEEKKQAETTPESPAKNRKAKVAAKQPKFTREELRQLGLDPACYGYAKK
ncbi:hypothetical protein [Rhodoligotrophos defluvii]|uniref:hypothetical protein n=1 Tax=Rhodoligotrophos defluvii TaxID=2561934 RepID=UPI00148511FE|nr:hypothetical protein [Rhodoligotrophos defluvii]